MEGTVGEIRLFAANFAPVNWAYCDGSLVAIRSNTALFSILGNYYGGDGKTTFGLPDLRGRSAVGASTTGGAGLTPYTIGESTGENQVVLDITNMPGHIHPINATINVSTFSDTGGLNFPGGNALGAIPNGYTASAGDSSMAPFRINVQLAPAGGTNQALSIQQPYIGMNYIICMYGDFPARD